jgi:hypothetical protein
MGLFLEEYGPAMGFFPQLTHNYYCFNSLAGKVI